MIKTISRTRLLADYGGVLSAGLCALHCAAGPVLLAWWGGRPATGDGDWLFLLLSGALVVLATRQRCTRGLRLALWGNLALFAATVLLADRYPVLEKAQYVGSCGLIGVHLLNLRYCRRCAASPAGNAGPLPVR